MADLKVPVGNDDHCAGDESAAVTLVEYGDFQCPDCGVAYPIVKQLQKHFGDDLRFVYRNFPLPMHEFAETAAEAAEFAGSKGKYWEMHDALFEHQEEFSETFFGDLAEQVDLNPAALSRALENESFEDKIEDDVNSGEQSGVHGTPTFFINGKLHDDSYDLATLRAAIEAAVEK
ncbi:DsbA family protein [Terriglobus aquaticus]|uniref:DsbA family protein n=1 Tax=Terriglobus aquaticus TaxID=940139 RepID=A0ABW9KP24_9BACT|nr:DsbA family protein [Terriglobus aquaticus]